MTIGAVDLDLLASSVLSAASQFAVVVAACQRKGMCGHVHAIVTAPAPDTFYFAE